jgi:MutS domain V
MKAFLMYRDRDFGAQETSPPNAAELIQDLELNTLLGAMASGDKFLLELATNAVLASLRAPEVIRYRQRILEDCLVEPDLVREMYTIAVEAIERERKAWGWMVSSRYPESVLHGAIEVLKIFFELLKRLRQIADEHSVKFRSEGFSRLFRMLAAELDDAYLAVIEGHLSRLKFRKGVLISAELGRGVKGTNFVLRKPPETPSNWFRRLQERLPFKSRSGYYYEVAERDEAGARFLTELTGRGIAQVAAALGQSTDHILSFFKMLRLELGFYVGCLNLRDRLTAKGEPICIPEPVAAGHPLLSSKALYDVCLSLTMADRVVGNDIAGDEKLLVTITGANRGGKSTLLRSLGLAQLMMQCGMFAPARFFRADIRDGVFTHFKREEDVTMRSGKLDEELSRMSTIVTKLTPNSLVLLNESFASTNEREGSEIARQIIRAMLGAGIKVYCVTHLFDLAAGFYRARTKAALFLRAERLPSGERTFRLVAGEPLPTSYGEDLYRRIFGKPTVSSLSPRS